MSLLNHIMPRLKRGEEITQTMI